jgi:hypothetical protein
MATRPTLRRLSSSRNVNFGRCEWPCWCPDDPCSGVDGGFCGCSPLMPDLAIHAPPDGRMPGQRSGCNATEWLGANGCFQWASPRSRRTAPGRERADRPRGSGHRVADLLPPQPLESSGIKRRIAHRIGDLAVPEIRLQGASVQALIGERVARGRAGGP